MKSLLLVFACLSLATANPVETKDQLKELIEYGLDYARMISKMLSSYAIPPMSAMHLQDQNVDIQLSLKDVTYFDFDFTVDKIETNGEEMSADFQITVPSSRLEGAYETTGVAFNKQVSGAGHFKIFLKRLVDTAHIQFTNQDGSFQIKDINFGYSFEDMEVEAEGMKIEGLTSEQVKTFLKENFLKYFNEYKDFYALEAAKEAKEAANRLFEGKSLKDVIDYFKQLVPAHST